MLLSRRDMLLLRLVSAYRYIPYAAFDKLALQNLQAGFEPLKTVNLIALAPGGNYLRSKPKAYELLDSLGFRYKPAARREYKNSPTLRRRLEVASVMLTCLRAGIDVLRDKLDALSEQPVFYPAFYLRGGDGNLMNAASCVGFGNWGNRAYMLQYVGSDSRGMFIGNELTQFHNLSSVFGGIEYPKAMLFVGDSYGEVYDRVRRRVLPESRRSTGYSDYSEVYANARLPIHLTSCDEAGARQLAIMRQSDYNARIAHAAFGTRLNADAEIPEADGCVEDFSLIVGVDMNLHRIRCVIDGARKLGRREAVIAVLSGEMHEFYSTLFGGDAFVKVLPIPQAVLTQAFGNAAELFTPNASTPATTESGAVINA